MSEDIIIKNGDYSITISTFGAQLMSYKKGKKEYIWQGDKKYWTEHAPILFPVAGAFKDEIYVYNGVTYPFPKHGFIKRKEFKVVEKTENSLTLLRQEDNETLKSFPFKFSFYAYFRLDGDSLYTEYRVTNNDIKTMYFSCGAHEGYALEDNFENYAIKFDQEEELISPNIEGVLLGKTSRDLTQYKRVLPLNYEYFTVDALVFRHLKSREVSLLHNGVEEARVSFPDAGTLLLWTRPGGKYICIEPWVKSPDFVDSPLPVEEKEDLVCLKPGKTYVYKHRVNIF